MLPSQQEHVTMRTSGIRHPGHSSDRSAEPAGADSTAEVRDSVRPELLEGVGGQEELVRSSHEERAAGRNPLPFLASQYFDVPVNLLALLETLDLGALVAGRSVQRHIGFAKGLQSSGIPW